MTFDLKYRSFLHQLLGNIPWHSFQQLYHIQSCRNQHQQRVKTLKESLNLLSILLKHLRQKRRNSERLLFWLVEVILLVWMLQVRSFVIRISMGTNISPGGCSTRYRSWMSDIHHQRRMGRISSRKYRRSNSCSYTSRTPCCIFRNPGTASQLLVPPTKSEDQDWNSSSRTKIKWS